jgi:hypothetical protein
MTLHDLVDSIDQLAQADPFSYADRESVTTLLAQLSRLECIVSRAVASFDEGGEWATEGAKTSVAWLHTRTHLPKGLLRSELRRGRAMPELPVAARAWSNGEISPSHFDALNKARARVSEVALARDEAMLVSTARELKFEPFATALAYWEQLADPDGTEEAEMARQARRDFYLAQSINGTWLGQMNLDPISGAIVKEEHERLEMELFEGDWAEAKERLGRDPRLSELKRTSAQRRADALREMAIRSRSMPPDARRPAPLFSVLVDYPTLQGRICQLAQGQAVTPGSLVPWLDEALIERAVFSPGRRVEIGITTRLFTGATRRAIELRDQTCTHEYCDVPADKCQIDHIVPVSQGGPSTQDNSQVHCGFHNRLRIQRPPPGG